MRGVRALRVAVAGILMFSCFCGLPLIRGNPRLLASFGAATFALLLFLVLVYRQARAGNRKLEVVFDPRPVHYVQLTMHASIYAYWGWYWREVYHYAPLIVAQIAFAYVFDMLLCWLRRDRWILGFGPVPIVLSTNLFLWFKDDWFYLQFALIATGFLCKEFVTWTRDGRRAHIFNPSAIALCLFSIGLLATGSTHLTWGEEVAVTLGRPPHIYLEIFLLGLVVQALFSVTMVTLCAAAALFALNFAYTHTTGLYYFVDSNIPIATFLGLHLLITDPATSPRQRLGKALFGVMYGAGVFGIYGLLSRWGAPTFYDKLLCVPALNLLVPALDRLALSILARFRSTASWSGWSPARVNVVHMAVWVAFFALVWSSGFVGSHHPGSEPEFWVRKCQEGSAEACRTMERTLNVACLHDSGRACIAMGVIYEDGKLARRDFVEAAKDFGRACDLRIEYGCQSLAQLAGKDGARVLGSACAGGDGESCFLLASLHYAGRGVAKDYTRAAALFRESCGAGWWRGCAGLAECYRAGLGAPRDEGAAIAHFEKACRAGLAPSCFAEATLYRDLRNEPESRMHFKQACELSTRNAIARTSYFRGGGQQEAGGNFCGEPSLN